MEGISLAGLVGAIVGTAVAGVNYHLLIGVLDKTMRERDREQNLSAEERDGAEARLSLVRRIILTVDLFVFAAIGYWIGMMWWG
jgi:hypothetical protein